MNNPQQGISEAYQFKVSSIHICNLPSLDCSVNSLPDCLPSLYFWLVEIRSKFKNDVALLKLLEKDA